MVRLKQKKTMISNTIFNCLHRISDKIAFVSATSSTRDVAEKEGFEPATLPTKASGYSTGLNKLY